MDCVAFSTLFPETVFLRGTSQYHATTTSYFAAFENELQPMCVVRPPSAVELGKIVKHLSSLPLHVQVAVKGGGHTAWAGSANIEGGILIDLQSFKGTVVHSDTNTATIAAGERWGDVYAALESKGLAVPGGRVSKVGVSGLVLGGGLSFFSEQRGFVCDEVTNFEVVLASGDVVQANKDEYSDLFRALKGGNNNFGIVTKFDLPTFTQGKMWGGAIFLDASAWPAVVDNFHTFAASPDNNTDVSPTLKNFTTIQPQLMATIREDTLLGFAQEQSNFSSDGARQLYFTTSFRNNKQVMLKAIPLFDETIRELESVPGLVLSLTLQPISRQMLTSSAKHGPNSMGLTPEAGPLINVLLNTVHEGKENDQEVIDAVQKLRKKIEDLSAEESAASSFRYLNYAYKGTPVFEGYGKDSIAALKAASKKYDPKQFFQTVVPGGFKISTVQ